MAPAYTLLKWHDDNRTTRKRTTDNDDGEDTITAI